MSNLPFVSFQPQDSSGAVYSGAKLYTYQAGSEVDKATYPSEADALAGTNANANPVIADANGRFPEIFLLTDGAYKLALKTSADADIDEWDNVNATVLRSTSFQVRVAQVASNPLDYGAVGDGVADESSQVQSAIDNATGAVNLLGKTFKCNSQITLGADGLTLENGTLNFASCTDDQYIRAVGSMGDAVALSSSATAGDMSIAVASAAGLAQGDWLYVKSDANYNGGAYDNGEVVQIESISGTTITLREPLIDSYTTVNNAEMRKLTPRANITLRNVRIICSDTASGAGVVVDLSMVKDAVCENVRVFDSKGAGFRVYSSVGVELLGCLVIGTNGNGDGYTVGAASRNVRLAGCRAHQCDTGFRIGAVTGTAGYMAYGVTRWTQLDGVGAYGCSTAINVEVGSDLCTLRGDMHVPASATGLTNNGNRIWLHGLSEFGDSGAGDYNGFEGTGGQSGAGLKGTGGTSGEGVIGVGGGAAAGVHGTGGATGYGVHGVGGATSGSGVRGEGSGGNAKGVEGVGNGSGAGTHGTGQIGAYGVANAGSGSGTYGDDGGTGAQGAYGYASKAGGNAVKGVATDGRGVVAEGKASSPNYGAFRMVPQNSAPGGPNLVGDFYTDTSGVLYSCTVAGTPGTWTKVSLT